MNLLRNTAIGLCVAGQLAAEPFTCADPMFEVDGGDVATQTRVCTAASDARKSLKQCGVSLDRNIEIEIVKAFDAQYNACLGLYHCGEDRIEILAPAELSAARDRDGPFELISDDAYWDSILAHELTHAAYDTIECPFSNCIVTSEYASYAMQVFSMPEDQRDLFGQTVTLRSKPSYDAITEVMLFLAPGHFAKIAWLHFQDREQPCGYMRMVMEGQIFFDREPL
ncbi:MAG: hypothetical protein HKN18_14465 [Silicimonas sp.]|nr:hypothetical protein [Silicimonas sp.]